MRSVEIADLLDKWKAEESVLRCSGTLAEFSFEMKCRISSLSDEAFTLSSEHGDCSLTFRLDSVETEFSYMEPREFSSAMGLSLTTEQDLSSTLIALLHPNSFPNDTSKPRDKLQLMELTGLD